MGGRRDLTAAERSEIIGARKCGVKMKVIAEKLNVSVLTVTYTIKKWQQLQQMEHRPALGRPCKLSPIEGESLIQMARDDPFVSLEEMRQAVPHVDRVTVGRFMNKNGFEKRPADHYLKGPRPRQAMAWVEVRKVDMEIMGEEVNIKPRSAKKSKKQLQPQAALPQSLGNDDAFDAFQYDMAFEDPSI